MASDPSKAGAPAVVLLSGGLDSYTAAALVGAQGYRLYALTVRYGQRHVREIEAARAVARDLGVARHVELDVDLSVFGGSSLTGTGDVPKDRPLDAGELSNATAIEAFTAVLLQLNIRYKTRVAPRLNGIKGDPRK